MNKIHNNSGRSDLRKFWGQEVNFQGLIVDSKSPTPNQKFICLRKMMVGCNGECVHCHHLWLDVSHLKDLKVRMCQWIQGCAYVDTYTRRNGSRSFGITEPFEIAPIAA